MAKRFRQFTEEEARELDESWGQMEARARTLLSEMTQSGLALTEIGSSCAAALVLSAKLEGRTLESVQSLIEGLWTSFRLVEHSPIH